MDDLLGQGLARLAARGDQGLREQLDWRVKGRAGALLADNNLAC